MTFKRNFWLLLAWLFFASFPPAVQAEPVTLNFVNADIQSVIKTVGIITNKNFILDPRVNGTINIVSNGPVARELVYDTLLSALRLQGFAAVEENGFTKIVPEADAKLNRSPINEGSVVRGRGDRIVTQVYQLQYESAAQLLPVLRPLITPNNVIAAYPNNNTLVITDYAENIRRLLKIIASIDVPAGGEVQTIKLQYASAVDVGGLIARVMPETAAPSIPGVSPRLLVSVDPRTNSLLVRSDNPSVVTRIRALVAGMDIPTATTGNIHVVYLRNAEATKLAEVLRGLMSGQPATAPSAAPAPAGAQLGQQAGLQTAQTASAASSSSSQVSSSIQAYPATNSLIIIAPDHVYNSLRHVIEKLDARRAQVFIEALIVEVSSTQAAEFGIQWQYLGGSVTNGASSTTVFGGTNYANAGTGNINNAAANPAGIGGGLNLGLVRGTIKILGQEILNIPALARALESEAKTNILSAPTLMTLDNEEAKIVVGQNVAFVTGSYTQPTGGTGTNPFQTFERKDVGLTLKIKPQVSEGGSVKLQISQEVSSVAPGTSSAANGPTTNKRSFDQTVLADDGQFVVLGGLIQDDVNNGADKVPLLGNIPILGNLFRYEKRDRTKTNLMVFLRPVVLRDAASTATLTGDRYDYIRKEQIQVKPEYNFMLPDMPVPVLPNIGNANDTSQLISRPIPRNIPQVVPLMPPAPTSPPSSTTPPASMPVESPRYTEPATRPPGQ
ncbi:MAG: type II secretion system secretin GspD [Burkholderiales bacterium]